MAIYHGNNKYGYKTGIVSTKRTAIITNTSYGGIKHLMLMPFIQELKYQNKLLEYKEINNLSFSGKVPTNKKRAKSLFELEEEIVGIFGKYVLIRIDLKSCSRKIKISKDEYLKFIKDTRNNVRHNSLMLMLLCGWCYLIEDDSYGDDHVHWYLFINADRYSDLSTTEANRLYKKDLDYILTTIYKYLDSKDSNISYCNINLADMSNEDSKNKLIIIDRNDYLLRNCARAWCTYICKKENKAIGKHYGKSIFENNNMKENEVNLWLNSLDRVMTVDEDGAFLSAMIPGVKNHLSRIDDLFQLEDEISSNYDNYLLLPFQLSSNTSIFTQSDISNFIKKYNSYKFKSPDVFECEVAYFWMINEIDNLIDYYFNVFVSFGNRRVVSDSYEIINTIKRWIYNSFPEITPDCLHLPIVSNDDFVYTSNFHHRNKTRLQLVKMSITQNEDKDMSPRNYRLFSKSKVKVRNK